MSRKSTAMNLGIDLLQQVDADVKIIKGAASVEALYRELSDGPDTRLLIFADELRALLTVAQRSGTANLLPKLNTLYGCPDTDSIDRRRDSESDLVERPFVSLIAGSPVAWLEDVFGHGTLDGGFLNRNLFIAGQRKLSQAFPPPPQWGTFANTIRTVIDHWRKNPQEIDWTPAAKALYQPFYEHDWPTLVEQSSDDTNSLTARLPDHVVKIAIIYSVLSGSQQITDTAVQQATRIAMYLRPVVLTLFGDVGRSRIGRVESKILEHLTAAGGWMPVRDLQQQLGRDPEAFHKAIGLLEKDDSVRRIGVLQPSGRTKKTAHLHDCQCETCKAGL